MRAGYDNTLRRRIDEVLQFRAGIGGSLFALILIAGAWSGGQNVWVVASICTAFAIFATVLGKRVAGMMDRRIPNVGFFIANTAYALAVMWASDFAAHAVFIVPVVILFYDGFSEGETRPFVIAMLVTFACVPIGSGADPRAVTSAVGLGFLIHWFSEGRALTLRSAVAEVKNQAEDLRRANEHMQRLNRELDARGSELRANLEKLEATQRRLVQSEKMAAVGQLAAGVAHEINNPLAVILGFAQGMNHHVGDGSPLRLPVTSIVRESLRCKSLVQELLVFSRSAKPTHGRVELARLLRGTAQLLDARARTQETRLSLELAGDIPDLSASGTQLQQVIVNLGNNALDAIGSGGELLIRSRYSDTGEIYIEVHDTGPGIPEDIRTRIFEPFFTTKDVGKGTGLGLTLVYEIVQQHGGMIDVESEAGKGTTMRVRLPIEGRTSMHAIDVAATLSEATEGMTATRTTSTNEHAS